MSESRSETARLNGAKSKGPVSIDGKAKSSQNALKHGLTAERVVVEGEDLDQYVSLRDAYVEQFQPANQLELDLIESLATTRFRLRRAVTIETGIFDNELSDLKNSPTCAALDSGHRIAYAFSYASNSIGLVSRYEASLNRVFDRTLKQLQALQKARLAQPQPELRNEPKDEPDDEPVEPAVSTPANEDHPASPGVILGQDEIDPQGGPSGSHQLHPERPRATR
jgi:hypothetical protein